MSPTSPVSSRHGGGGGFKRKRSAGLTGVESSPGSFVDHDHEDDHADGEKKRQPGVKRACNECRQQKVRGNPNYLAIDLKKHNVLRCGSFCDNLADLTV